MKDTTIGVDLAKQVIQLHAASMTGEVKFRKKVSRGQFAKQMASQAPAVFEVCCSTGYWARETVKLDHEVKPIAPQYVKPFVKRQSEADRQTIR